MREMLLGYLLGALEGPEQELVEAQLQFDPQWREELGRLRQRMARLDALCLEAECEPPPGLAARTCLWIFSRPRVAEGRARETLSRAVAPPSGAPRVSRFDAAVLGCIAVAAVLLVAPAINLTRFNAQVSACQDNLRELGVAMTRFSEQHDGYFPRVPTQGKLAVAGIYAPTLARSGLLYEARKVICPSSPLAEAGSFELADLGELEDLPAEQVAPKLSTLGGSYGYTLGHVESGVYRDIRNQQRPFFAIMADAPSLKLPGVQSLNHGGRGENVLFEDGHVRFVTTSRPSGVDDIFSNDAGRIAAGLHPNDSVIVPSDTAPVVILGNQ